MAINKVMLVGNVTADCKSFEKDGAITCIMFSLAVDERRRKANSDEWESVPNFFNCAIFGKRAAGLKDSIKKGIRVTILGHLRYQTYGEGEHKRSSVSIIVDDLEFMTSKQQTVSNDTEEIPFDC